MAELTNLEICKRIAEIEGYSKFGTVWGDLVIVSNEDDTTSYNPLTDDALCFQLMIKHKVLITWNPHINDNCTAVIDGTSEDLPFPFAIADCNDKSPNKAILLGSGNHRST